ncbi:MAG: PfkB family carbohydrate kinase [Ktedonobacterales bacterium]
MPAAPSIPDIPDFLAIGHATRDLLPGGDWRLGGSVAFAALTANRLGLRSALVTSGPPDVLQALYQALPGIEIQVVPSSEATIFENVYTSGVRRQYLRGRARPLTLDAIPARWRAAPVILFAPLVGEIGPDLPAALSRSPGSLVAATPQGWLRHVAAGGAVSPAPFHLADRILPCLDAMILSYEDILVSPDNLPVSARHATAANPAGDPTSPDRQDPGEQPTELDLANKLVSSWAQTVPLVAVTRGAAGAVLFQAGRTSQAFPGYPAHEVDPTGAGDVFAAAFLVKLYRSGDAAVAMDFANRVAACSVEQFGVDGIPTYEAALARFGQSISSE